MRKNKRGFMKKRRVWVVLLSMITCIQMIALYGVDFFLRPPALATAEAAQAKEEQPKPEVPSDATRTEYSPNNQYAAYTTADNELVIKDNTGEIFHEEVGEVTYMQWLGESNSLVYFVQGKSLTAYVIHANVSKPTQIHRWSGTKREVVHTYFSPYMEFLYIELKNGSRTEVYKYDAVDGIDQLPLGDAEILDIQYDPTTDIMNLTTSEGKVWRYEHDKLYRPDGSQVRQSSHSTEPSRPNRAKGIDYPVANKSEGSTQSE